MQSAQTSAAVLPAARGAVEIRQVEVRRPGPGEVLLRIEACGICHSDVFVAGLEKLPLTPLTLGHEAVGVVEECGEGVERFAPGDRAGVTFLASTCGSCEWCAAGEERFCPRQLNFGYTLDGALAGRATLSAQRLVRIPHGLAAAEAAPLCCAGWTAFGALREAGLAAGATVALFGYGGLGHLALRIAKARGLRAAVVDAAESKLAEAREDGAAIVAPAAEAGRTLQKEYGGVDAALVLTASPVAVEQAFRSLRRRGRLVIAGLATARYDLPLVDTVLKGIEVRGSYLGTASDLEEVFALASAGLLRPRVHTHEIGETPELLAELRAGRISGRAVVTF